MHFVTSILALFAALFMAQAGRTAGPWGSRPLLEYRTDGVGRVIEVKDARGGVTRRRFDVEGQPVEAESPTGVVSQLAYDAEDNLVEARDPTRHVRFRHGGFHDVVSRTEAGAELRFDYDKEGRLTAVVNEAGERYSFGLDRVGLVATETGFDGRTRRYERDRAGRVTKTHLPSGRHSAFAFDAGGRIAKVTHSDGTFAELAYGADGALVGARNESADLALDRDALGRVVRERSGDTWVASHYALDGERHAVETSLGGCTTAAHDPLGAVAALRIGPEPWRQDILRYERDALGGEVARHMPGGITVAWGRDTAGRPLERHTTHRRQGVVREVNTRHYEWRGEDQIASIFELGVGPRQFDHDARGRLVRDRTVDRVVERAMDAVGNVYRTANGSDRRYGPGGRLEEADGTHYEHDEDGNQVRKVEPDGSVWAYHWNGAGMLREVERPDGQRVRFEYDAFARRTRKTLVRLAHGAQPPNSTTCTPASGLRPGTSPAWNGCAGTCCALHSRGADSRGLSTATSVFGSSDRGTMERTDC